MHDGAEPDHLDVVIVGAGLSGIAAGYHLQTKCPGKSYAILEGRGVSGGTWDLFRYPGVRSDSDMYTLGYAFKPWTHGKAIADGPAILEYIRETAREHGIDSKIRYGHRVVGARWSSEAGLWTLTVDRGRGAPPLTIACRFLILCAGYYRYDRGHLPNFDGVETFTGQVVHPQFWPKALDYTGKRVVVIGSGATAVTLVPAMAERAAQVVMLQRSPTYVVSRPSVDAAAERLRARLPTRAAYAATRWKNVLRGMYVYRLCKRQPERVKAGIVAEAGKALGETTDVARHFTPRYKPWDQRLCLVPDGDLFHAIRQGRAVVETAEIDRFTARGVRLKDGRELAADIIVTATGLEIERFGGIAVEVDGRPIDPARLMIYRGMMYSGVPNLASVFGYTNASWTLKADLVLERVCRVIAHMTRKGYSHAVPELDDPSVKPEPWVDFSSGYIRRAAAAMPKQGSKAPWRLHQNYVRDLITLRYGRIEDGVMAFYSPSPNRLATSSTSASRASGASGPSASR